MRKRKVMKKSYECECRLCFLRWVLRKRPGKIITCGRCGSTLVLCFTVA